MFATLLALCLSTPAEAKGLSFDILTPTTTIPAKGVVDSKTVIDIAAAPEFVAPYVVSLAAWDKWTAWDKAGDPTSTWTYGGTDGQVGSTSAWSGKVYGSGRLAITAVNADNGGIAYDLWFGRAKDASRGRITISKTETGSRVEWEDVMSWGFPTSLFHSGKKMAASMVTDFDKGLVKLKGLAEADATEAARKAEEARVAAEATAKAAADEAAKAAEATAKAAEAVAAEEAAKSKKKKKKK